MPTFWDPRLVLNVYPLRHGFTCSATTARGTRCDQAFIRTGTKRLSDGILENLSSKNVVTHGLDEDMKQSLHLLAELTQCPRWHRNANRSQTTDIYLRWIRTIDDFTAEERMNRPILLEQVHRRPRRVHEPLRAIPAQELNARLLPQPEPVQEARPAVNEGGLQHPRDMVSLSCSNICNPP
jgi:hypothetical protein